MVISTVNDVITQHDQIRNVVVASQVVMATRDGRSLNAPQPGRTVVKTSSSLSLPFNLEP